MSVSLPCIRCGKQLDNVWEENEVLQPSGGTYFSSGGHYGSTVFDGPGELVINFCDDCLIRSAKEGRVLLSRTQKVKTPPPEYSAWDPDSP